ncbi:MAG TPA: aldo/keto reductase [Cellulomonas sp.]
MTSVPLLTLNNGVQIPQLGLGVWQVDPAETQRVVEDALELGYRHVDTAQMYGNESGVGAALATAGLPRDEVFVTSKLNNNNHEPARARESFDRTLEALGTDHVDLFLIHWPTPAVGDFVDTWRVLEEFYESGRARAIGTSNFHQHHLDRIAAEASVTPAANQIEVYPYLTQEPLRAYDKDHGIVTEVWSPLGSGTVLGDETLARIAAAHGVSPAQVTIRWHLQRGDVVFPKSTHRDRMAQNLDVLGFTLSDDEVAAISALNKDLRTGPNPDEFNWIPRD